ncbi:hydrolase [Dulcicalothrix desertica PCC 7102]|uniref:Hydrolase n=1 Tax=Dulcicalothrix desertica PCC 7102 TaxID=232991 RepID=A0A433VKG2_9CYAN|nr:alpha/beta hydrolase [Dulcicalothrix desertica]RUT06557.1 hydrolase [Dulcicalothrix desertica PCC 7102]TWH50329.1 pimeloyl-ACP methyl ester carboxylesterase [Dulcicalothrix desertica PCC 7102]
MVLISQLTNHRVDLEDCTIFYQQSRLESSSIPILFLHGWGISTEPYTEVLKLLALSHTIIAPDLPSFARSSYSKLIPDYVSYSKILLSFIEVLDLQQFHVVGHSLGGGIAITLSTLVPEKVRSVILVDSTGIPAPSIPEMIPRRAIEMTVQMFLPRHKLKLVDIPLVFSYNLLFNTGNVIQGLLISVYEDISHLLPKIQAPCLLLWSDKDLTTPLNNAQEMAAIIPNSKLITVEEGLHEWALWYPEKFTSLILNFISQLD